MFKSSLLQHAGNRMERYGRVKICLPDASGIWIANWRVPALVSWMVHAELGGVVQAIWDGLTRRWRVVKLEDVARQTWKCCPSKPKISSAKLSPTLRKCKRKGFLNKKPERCQVLRLISAPAKMARCCMPIASRHACLTWRLPSWLTCHSTQKYMFCITTPH